MAGSYNSPPLDIDLATLLQRVRENQDTCILSAEIKRVLPTIADPPYMVELHIVRGALTFCIITNRRNQVVKTSTLPPGFPSHTMLTWHFHLSAPELSPSPAPNQWSPSRHMLPVYNPSFTEDATPPIRNPGFARDVLLSSLSPDERKVYALIDGARSRATIAAILHFPPERVSKALNLLRLRNLIL